jgi:hypothetical protein
VIPENLARARRLFWLGRAAALVGAVAAPPLTFCLAMVLVNGHAQREYFEAVSQILPVLLLALAVEQRYFTRARSIPDLLPPELNFGEAEIKKLARSYTSTTRLYALIVLFALGLGEWISIEVLATGQSSTGDLKATAGSLAAGFTALIITALVGTKQTSE